MYLALWARMLGAMSCAVVSGGSALTEQMSPS